ncbi:MAG: phosphate regulon sensor histidine kinase PhoR [Nevskiales bacterium]|nr:phosphate regulon sensor histidine kinase PhoR [Nevskiales bacterium]
MWTVLRRQIFYATLVALLGGLIGWPFNASGWGMGLALALWLVRQLYHLAMLRAWVDNPKRVELPETSGVWGEVYERLLDLQRRNRKRKKRLADLLSQFQASAEALPYGAVVLEERGEIVWYNTAARALLGLRGQADLGQRLPNLLRHPAFTDYFARGDFKDEVEIPSPVNTEATLALQMVLYGDNQRLLLVRDVSELRRLERIRRDFVANASHELRTPLTVLRGYLEMMQPEARSGKPLAEWRVPLNEMHAQATRMEALIKALLKLARLEADASQSRQDILDVPALLERILSEIRVLSRGKHRFVVQIESGLFLFGHEVEAESIFTNLMTNAVQYTPGGGTITIQWRWNGEGACFSVNDTGIGIAPENIPRLTERFYRVDEGRSSASGGTGLGLSIVKHALERFEGRLEIHSRPDEGSRFICHFPPHRVQRQEPVAA